MQAALNILIKKLFSFEFKFLKDCSEILSSLQMQDQKKKKIPSSTAIWVTDEKGVNVMRASSELHKDWDHFKN